MGNGGSGLVEFRDSLNHCRVNSDHQVANSGHPVHDHGKGETKNPGNGGREAAVGYVSMGGKSFDLPQQAVMLLQQAFEALSKTKSEQGKQSIVVSEGPEKATRGGEWEPIKIPLGNLAYIPKSIRRPSLLSRSRPHSYSKAVGPRNRARNHSGITERC
jgi:hypothetical protein